MEEDYEITWRAIQKAKNAFYRYLEDEEVDGAYWDLSIDVDLLSIDFTDVIEHFHWDNKEEKKND